MRYLVLFDSFKGTISSSELGKITTSHLKGLGLEADYFVISDGGDGFLDSICYNLKIEKIKIKTKDAFLNDNYSFIAKKDDTFFVELASSVGINHVAKEQLNPYIASSFGFGMAIKEAIKRGAKKIVMGIGGSCSNDAGCGMLEALGAKFYSDILLHNMNNEKLSEVKKVDFTNFKKVIDGVEFIVASDVDNPLLGENGATYVYSKQKGATEKDFSFLEGNIKSFTNIFNDVNVGVKGSGAAGGVGYSLITFLNALFVQGIDYILDLIEYDKKIKNYDAIITGEGKLDNSSFCNKAISGIIKRSKDKEIILINGSSNIEVDNIKIYNIVPDITSLDKSISKSAKKYFKERLDKITFLR